MLRLVVNWEIFYAANGKTSSLEERKNPTTDDGLIITEAYRAGKAAATTRKRGEAERGYDADRI